MFFLYFYLITSHLFLLPFQDCLTPAAVVQGMSVLLWRFGLVPLYPGPPSTYRVWEAPWTLRPVAKSTWWLMSWRGRQLPWQVEMDPSWHGQMQRTELSVGSGYGKQKGRCNLITITQCSLCFITINSVKTKLNTEFVEVWDLQLYISL